MLQNILFVIVGIALVLWGADRLTNGAVAIAKRMNIPQIVIGLTIVAFGTSMPEFCVSLVSALKGTPDLAVGNVVGSNIFNALLVVGASALCLPITIARSTVKKDIPFALLASIALLVMWQISPEINRIDAAILLVLFVAFMMYTLRLAKEGEVEEEEEKFNCSVGSAVFFIILGLACLILGSNLFVNGASALAIDMGVSEAVVGLTIVAGGTSLPELATSLVAAWKGRSAIAIGNVLGSNVFNILFILGVTGVIQPMRPVGITMTDMIVMVVSMLLLWLFSYTKLKIERWEGAVLTVFFFGYMWYIIAGA